MIGFVFEIREIIILKFIKKESVEILGVFSLVCFRCK